MAGPDAVPAIDLINDAFELVGVRSQGETLTPANAQSGLRRLNAVVAQMSLMPLTMSATVRETFPLLAGKGTPSAPYTIGPGGDFNTVRPVEIEAIGLLVMASPPYELRRTLYTDLAYQSIEDKTLGSTYFAGAYFSPTYANGLGEIFLYPIPTVLNRFVLYRKQAVARFADLTTPYDLPPGASDAITYELGRRLAAFYQRPWSADLQKDASDYMGIFKRMNTRMTDLTLDPALTESSAQVWDIESDP